MGLRVTAGTGAQGQRGGEADAEGGACHADLGRTEPPLRSAEYPSAECGGETRSPGKVPGCRVDTVMHVMNSPWSERKARTALRTGRKASVSASAALRRTGYSKGTEGSSRFPFKSQSRVGPLAE